MYLPIITKTAKMFLNSNQVNRFPLDLNAIAKDNHWEIMSYREAKNTLPQFSDFIDTVISSRSGAVITDGIKAIILFNPRQSPGRIKFTIAHEMGHILMEDLNLPEDELESLCNAFAANLLAPFSAIRHYGITDVDGIMTCFGMSRKAAELRIANYNKWKCKGHLYPSDKLLLSNLSLISNIPPHNIV